LPSSPVRVAPVANPDITITTPNIISGGSMVAKVVRADTAQVILTIIETDFFCDD
jgi:hypothetical protein